jgi:chromate transporter
VKLSTLFRLWLSIGAQSFGGGAATSYLIQQTFVDRLRLFEPVEYAELSAMVQLVPGMNLLALTTLIGWRLHRTSGLLASLAGLLLPSVSISLAMSAAYLGVQSLTVTQAALRGVVPAMAGVSVATLWRTVFPVIKERRREGAAGLGLSVLVLLGCGAIALLEPLVPVFVLYALGGGALALWFWARQRGRGGNAQ